MWPKYAEIIIFFLVCSFPLLNTVYKGWWFSINLKQISSLSAFKQTHVYLECLWTTGAHPHTRVLLWTALSMCLTWTVKKGKTFEVRKAGHVGSATSTGWASWKKLKRFLYCRRSRLSLQLLFKSKIQAISRLGYPITRTCGAPWQELARKRGAFQDSHSTHRTQSFGYHWEMIE